MDVSEITGIKDGDRLTIAPVPAKEIIPTKVSFEINRGTLRWQRSLSAEVNENINLGYSQDQSYS